MGPAFSRKGWAVRGLGKGPETGKVPKAIEQSTDNGRGAVRGVGLV